MHANEDFKTRAGRPCHFSNQLAFDRKLGDAPAPPQTRKKQWQPAASHANVCAPPKGARDLNVRSTKPTGVKALRHDAFTHPTP